MQRIVVAAATLNQTPLDWDGNRARILSAIDNARTHQVSLLCLPELAITGYGCEDAFFGGWVSEQAWEVLQDIQAATRGLAVCVGLPIRERGHLYNGAALLVDGAIAGIVCKQHLASDGIHYESRWFRPWRADDTDDTTHRNVPLGDLYFDLSGIRVGFEICEDAWVAQRPGRGALERELDVILNPSASHFALGKHEVRKRLVLEGSRAFGVAYLYANLLGNEAGRVVYDGGAMVAQCGAMVSETPRLSFAETQLALATIDLEHIRNYRARSPSMAGGTRTTVDAPISVALSLPREVAPIAAVSKAVWDVPGPNLEHEETARTIALGLFDYLRKSSAKACVVSTSGGADSSAVACLVWLMAHFAAHEIGTLATCEKLGVAPCDLNELIGRVLHCVYQATDNSSARTEHAAREVAMALGARFSRIGVQSIVDQYTRLVEGIEGRALSWQADDVVLQNIQARVRGPGVWMLANLENALLLTTSNRSEAAVGYATMDGDTCGGLAPIAGLDKHGLRHWLLWLERVGPAETGPLPALALVNASPPTAELRPPERDQRDENDLMPYAVLDAIECAAIRDKRSPRDCLKLLGEQFPDASLDERKLWVHRFFELWSRNQWKRERYAPSFHLDDQNLDPKTWCRFPILSSGFAKELADL